MNAWQIAVVVLLVLGAIATLNRFGKAVAEQKASGGVRYAVAFIVVLPELALPFCLYRGGFFQ